jgi:hypothetical protein
MLPLGGRLLVRRAANSTIQLVLLLAFLGVLSSPLAEEYTFVTLAGSGGSPGAVDGTGRERGFPPQPGWQSTVSGMCTSPKSSTTRFERSRQTAQ